MLRVAALQMTSSADRAENVAIAGERVAAAATAGARLVLLPEKWNVIDRDTLQAGHAEDLDGPSLATAIEWARTFGVAIVAGSVSERLAGQSRAYNTSVAIDPSGTVVATYRKLHLFDVEVAGHRYRESASAVSGDEIVIAPLCGRLVGMSVCYDLRFPELYRALTLAGATILTVPAAFTAATGAAHWEVLLRARAIESQAFVIAAGQVGTHATGTASHGHSMIVDPWGTVLAECGEDDQMAIADLDFDRLAEVRANLPALEHRRADVYGTPGGSEVGR